VDLHGTKKVIGLAVTVRARERVDKVVPGTFGRLLDVTSRPRANLGHGFGEKFGLRMVYLVDPNDLMGFVHRGFRARGREVWISWCPLSTPRRRGGSCPMPLTSRVSTPPSMPRADLHLVAAHLGSGLLVTAVAGGRSVNSSMGFTPRARPFQRSEATP
jgi:hypothetical protein